MPMPSAAITTGPPGVISFIQMNIRAINRQELSPNANQDLAYTVAQGFTNSEFFTNATLDVLRMDTDPTTFTFPLRVALKHPFKL
jgi:hypothetical protein